MKQKQDYAYDSYVQELLYFHNILVTYWRSLLRVTRKYFNCPMWIVLYWLSIQPCILISHIPTNIYTTLDYLLKMKSMLYNVLSQSNLNTSHTAFHRICPKVQLIFSQFLLQSNISAHRLHHDSLFNFPLLHVAAVKWLTITMLATWYWCGLHHHITIRLGVKIFL